MDQECEASSFVYRISLSFSIKSLSKDDLIGDVEETILAQKGKIFLSLTCSRAFTNMPPCILLCAVGSLSRLSYHEGPPVYDKYFKRKYLPTPSLGICCIHIPDCAGRQGNSLQHRTCNKMPRDGTPNEHMLSWDSCRTWRRAATPGSLACPASERWGTPAHSRPHSAQTPVRAEPRFREDHPEDRVQARFRWSPQ